MTQPPRPEFVASRVQPVVTSSTTRVSQYIRAPRDAVYRALLDPQSVAHWKVPDGMRCTVHTFEPRVGGAIRVSLTYDDPSATGKTTTHTDTYRGRFTELVENERVVEVDEFESADPSLQGEMTITVTLRDAPGGTELEAVHEGLPDMVAPEDNVLGWRISLGKLAALVESGQDG